MHIHPHANAHAKRQTHTSLCTYTHIIAGCCGYVIKETHITPFLLGSFGGRGGAPFPVSWLCLREASLASSGVTILWGGSAGGSSSSNEKHFGGMGGGSSTSPSSSSRFFGTAVISTVMGSVPTCDEQDKQAHNCHSKLPCLK